MFKRRKRKNQTVSTAQPESSSPDRGPNIDKSPPSAAHVCQETKTPLLLSDAFKNAIKKAANRSRNELVSAGRIKPMAFFVHGDGTMKTVSLWARDEYQKELLTRRIREKVLAENISTVIVLTEMDNEKTLILSGVSAGMKGAAGIEYGFDNTTRTVTLWKMTWLSRPFQDIFLDGIFDRIG
jgi:hypothetical protein